LAVARFTSGSFGFTGSYRGYFATLNDVPAAFNLRWFVSFLTLTMDARHSYILVATADVLLQLSHVTTSYHANGSQTIGGMRKDWLEFAPEAKS